MNTIVESRRARVEGRTLRKPRALNNTDVVLHRVGNNVARMLALDQERGVDDQLLELSLGLGLLTDGVKRNLLGVQITALSGMAAHCMGWVESNPGPVKDMFAAIRVEREVQEGFLRAGKFSFTCASRIADPKRKLRVLIEEVGEVAQECDALEQTPKSRKVWPFLREELIQVSAVCVAWLESFEVQS
jgi:hypothetical protein